MRKDCVIFDIDGTLADCRHRLHYVTGDKRDWDKFFELLGKDECIKPVAMLLNALTVDGLNPPVLLTSGRPEKTRRDTEIWLAANYISGWEKLYMRPDGDTRADHIVKREMLEKIRAEGWNPILAIDDRPSVVNMWREEGLVCLQAAAGQEEVPESAVLTLMVGPSGGGKTTWLEAMEGKWTDARGNEWDIEQSHIISSDEVRRDMLGDPLDQSQNERVFRAVHDMARARLRHGLPTVIDATHLRRKDRLEAAKLVPATNRVRYIVIDRPMSEKVLHGGWRLNTKDKHGRTVIERHAMTFKSQLRDILRGDGLPNVEVVDMRRGE